MCRVSHRVCASLCGPECNTEDTYDAFVNDLPPEAVGNGCAPAPAPATMTAATAASAAASPVNGVFEVLRMRMLHCEVAGLIQPPETSALLVAGR